MKGDERGVSAPLKLSKTFFFIQCIFSIFLLNPPENGESTMFHYFS